MEYTVQVIRSNRKTISLEIKRDLSIVVRVPSDMKERDIQKFIAERSKWIEKHLARLGQTEEELLVLTEEDIQALADKAQRVIPIRVEKYAGVIGVKYGKITVRRQVTRWGSCTAEGNLNFNCLLMLCPDEVIDYVVIHELCHRRHMNHSKDFWSEVEKFCPDYKIHRQWLNKNGSRFISQLRKIKA